MPRTLRTFLGEKYGIDGAVAIADRAES
jgi:hypothetical protein